MLDTNVIENLLVKMGCEFAYTPEKMDLTLLSIRDTKDYPVIYTALMENIDILITGDKDFEELQFDNLEILTPTQFLTNYYS